MKIYTKVQMLEISYSEYRTMRKWCTSQFGVSDARKAKGADRPWYGKRDWVHVQRESAFLQVPRSSFYFRNPAYATVFALTWVK